MSLDEIEEYISSSIVMWSLTANRVDWSYELKFGRDLLCSEMSVCVYKVGKEYEHKIQSFIFGITPVEDIYKIRFFIDECERNILESLINENYHYHVNGWMKEFNIELEGFEEVKNFLNKHVWNHDLGYLY